MQQADGGSFERKHSIVDRRIEFRRAWRHRDLPADLAGMARHVEAGHLPDAALASQETGREIREIVAQRSDQAEPGDPNRIARSCGDSGGNGQIDFDPQAHFQGTAATWHGRRRSKIYSNRLAAGIFET